MLALLAWFEQKRRVLRLRVLDSVGGSGFLAIGIAAFWFGLTLYPLAGFGVVGAAVAVAAGVILLATVVLAPAAFVMF